MCDEIKKTSFVFIPGLALLAFSYGNYWSSHWYSKWSLLVALFSVIYSYAIAKKTSLVLFPVIVISLLSAAYISVWFNNGYRTMVDGPMMSALQIGAMYSYLAVIISTMAIAFIPPLYKNPISNVLASFCILSAGYTIAQFGRIAYERGAFSGNASMNACLIACLVPFALELHRKAVLPVLALSITSCLMTHSSMGIGTLAVVYGAYVVRYLGIPLKRLIGPVSVLSVSLLWALRCVPVAWLSSSGRVNVWKSVFAWWSHNSSIWFGAGLGSGMSLFPTIQKMYHTEATGYMLWLHSDWLQILFELGILGFAAAVVAYSYLAFRAWDRPHLFASLIGFGTCSIADYPVRLPIHCVAMTLLGWLILQNKRDLA